MCKYNFQIKGVRNPQINLILRNLYNLLIFFNFKSPFILGKQKIDFIKFIYNCLHDIAVCFLQFSLVHNR